MADNQILDVVISVPVQLRNCEGFPAIEIRKLTKDLDIMKHIISSAYHEQPIIIYPSFSNKMHAVGRLVELGILHKNEDTNQYEYTI